MNGCFFPCGACTPPSSENPLAEEEGDSRCMARQKGIARCDARGARPISTPGRCCAADIALNWLGEAPLAGALEARKAAGAFAAAARDDVVSTIAHTRGERRNMVCNAGEKDAPEESDLWPRRRLPGCVPPSEGDLHRLDADFWQVMSLKKSGYEG